MKTRELTHAETIVETNSKGQTLNRPKYGHRWSINDPQREGWTTTLYVGSEQQVRLMWKTRYADGTLVAVQWKHYD